MELIHSITEVRSCPNPGQRFLSDNSDDSSNALTLQFGLSGSALDCSPEIPEPEIMPAEVIVHRRGRAIQVFPRASLDQPMLLLLGWLGSKEVYYDLSQNSNCPLLSRHCRPGPFATQPAHRPGAGGIRTPVDKPDGDGSARSQRVCELHAPGRGLLDAAGIEQGT